MVRTVRRTLAVAVVALAFAVSGCGVTAQEDPQPIDRKDVPFGLLDEGAGPSTTSTTSPTSASTGATGLPTSTP